MSITMPAQYYDRTDPAKEFEKHLFISGRGLQSAELNEIQDAGANRLRGIADVLFKDGAIVRDATIIVDPDTGITRCASGAVYVRGAVRGVPPNSFTIPFVGTVAVGVRLVETIVTSEDDASLRDPATGTRNYDERGAERLKIHSQWGWDGDGIEGEFYPVYGVVDGIVSAKEPPPNLDAVTQALARYDRDSAGGTYVVNGMSVSMMDDFAGSQAYSIGDGRARVYGYGVEYSTARRVLHPAVPDLLRIESEPHLSSTIAAQRINLDRVPGSAITRVSITHEKTVTLTHGVVTGAQDPLPDTSVLSISEVKQGGTTFVVNTDYKLTSGTVDWSPSGAEPAPGSTYTVKYQYITTVAPSAVDDTGFTVTGAVVGSLVLVDYSQKLPRIDRLCIDTDGLPVWIRGVSSAYYPQAPSVPPDLLALASVYQSWTSSRKLTNDGVRVVAMPFIASLDAKIGYALQLIASVQLESSIHTREGGAKKGLFVDPFLDDSQRDAGTPQTAAIVNGELVLPITATISQMTSDIATPVGNAYSPVSALQQLLKTSSMRINPYMAFGLVPAIVTLTPSVDRWTEVQTDWASPTTNRFSRGSGDESSTSSVTRNLLINTSTTDIETLRSITVSFVATGFGPNELLSTMTFDGVLVTPVAP